jgi:hypothetical protein
MGFFAVTHYTFKQTLERFEMTGFYPHQKFADMASAFARAPEEMKVAADAAAGKVFPLADIEALADKPTYEALEAVDRKVSAWMSSGCDHELRAIEDKTGFDFDTVLDDISKWRPFRVSIMPEFVENNSGIVSAVPHYANTGDATRYHSLGNAAVHHGLEVSVFRHPIKAELVYNGTEALEARQAGKPLPDAVGTRSSYKVAIFDSEILMPPRWSSDLPQTSPEGMSL